MPDVFLLCLNKDDEKLVLLGKTLYYHSASLPMLSGYRAGVGLEYSLLLKPEL